MKRKNLYYVYYVIKKNNHGYLNSDKVWAKNQKEAFSIVREFIKKNTGHHAFNCTCKKPIKTENGILWDGKLYTKYSELFNTLW